MKLAHPKYFEPVEVTEEDPFTLIIENNKVFRKTVNEMIMQCNTSAGDFILSENNSSMNFGKLTMVITDLFSLNFELRQLKTKLNQICIEDCDDNLCLEIVRKLNELGSIICNTSRYPMTFNMEITRGDIIKLLNFQIDSISMMDTERILEFINMSTELLDKKLIIIVGIKDILNPKEYDEFIRLVQYKKIRLLMLEHRQHSYDDLSRIRIIDEDLCVI